MRSFLVALALFAGVTAAAAAAAPATDDELKAKILGNWADTDSCKDGYLMFNADGTFVSKAPEGSPPDEDLTGNYVIKDGHLSGKTPEFEMPTVAISFDGEKLVMGTGPSADILVHCQ
jgi:hypothetical protein